MFTGNDSSRHFGYPHIFVGSGTSPSTMTMTALQTFQRDISVPSAADLAGTTTTIVDGKWHQRMAKKIILNASNCPVTEIGFGYSSDHSIFSRVVLKNPILVGGVYTITYDFYISLPYHDRTFVSDLGGTGIPGELKMDESYYIGLGGISIPKLAPGFDANSSRVDEHFLVGPNGNNTNVPIGILIPYCFPKACLLSQCPMLSADTSLDFGDDNSTRLPYHTDGYCTCTPGSYVASQGYRDFTYTVSAAYPTASSGVLHIAYINLRGLAMRFGSYVNGHWVGQTLNKDGSYKLNISLRYTYTAE